MACGKVGAASSAKAICNSNSNAHGYALGGSVFWDKGYLGLSANTYRSSYGAVAEDNVRIDMQNDRYALESEIRQPVAFLETLKFQFGNTDYEHTEFDDGDGWNCVCPNRPRHAAQRPTSATSNGTGLHCKASGAGKVKTVVFQLLGLKLSCRRPKPGNRPFYLVEELQQPWGSVSLGLRSETVDVDGDAFKANSATAQSFSPASSALGRGVQVDARVVIQRAFGANPTRTQRL